MVNVRFAPSPTGLLHIGNIRAALFNWLHAHQTGGKFMLRLDDTDKERSTDAFAAAIERDLKWLGLQWDRFDTQSSRFNRYNQVLEELKAKGRAYPCFETQEELGLKRKVQLAAGKPPVYDRAALQLSKDDIQKLLDAGKKPYWRFRLEDRDTEWQDIIQGHKIFPAHSVSDPVLVRDDGIPLYTYCSVVDDVDHGTTHIIRGEDHVTNTSVQIQIWQAITTTPPPQFAHFPLLVSADGTEMSKRLGTLSIASLRDEMGLEPMAILSLLGRLGTSDAITPELTLEAMVGSFSLEKISRSTAKFDMNDILKLNSQILHATPYAGVASRLHALIGRDVGEAFWHVVRANIGTLSEAKQWWNVVYGDVTPVANDHDKDFLSSALALLPATPWDETTWANWTNALKVKTDRKGKDLFLPLRLALTAAEHGPDMKHLLPLMAAEKARARLARAV